MMKYLVQCVMFIMSTTTAIRNNDAEIQDLKVFSNVRGFQNVNLLDAHPETHPENLNVAFTAYGKEIVLTGSKKNDLFGEGYKEVHMIGGKLHSVAKGVTQCYYAGTSTTQDGVDSVNNTCFFSTCQGGIHGIFSLDGDSYSIEYVSEHKRHVVHKVSDYTPDKENAKCGVSHNHEAHDQKNIHGLSMETQKQDKKHVSVQRTNECANFPTKIVELLIINDVRRFDIQQTSTEANTNIIFSFLAAYYAGGLVDGRSYPGITAPSFTCEVQIRLIGQLTYRSSMPSSIESSLASIGNNEIDPSAYLDSVGVYISQNQNGIRNLFGTFDNVQVFSGFNFEDSTIGLAYVGSMCDSRFSVGINQVTDGRSFYNAAVVAHEMGHNFNMQHDTVPLVNVMSAVISQNAALEFSEESRGFINSFMENTYGRAGIFGVPTCLENDRLPLDGPICGDGQVEGTELCDQGFGAFDDFCLEDCTFGPAAVQCSLNEPCCDENLRFRPSTFVCRAAIHPECDIEDTCSGNSADCSRDLYQNVGTQCNDVTQFGVLESGLCFLGPK